MPQDDHKLRAEVAAAQAAEKSGDFKSAASHYVRIGSRLGATERAWAYHEAAIAFRQCDDLQAALSAVDLATESIQDDGDYQAAQIHLTAGNIQADLGHWDDALRRSQRARLTFESLGATVESLYARIGEARCLSAQGNSHSALTIYGVLASPGQPFQIRTQAINNMALIHADLGDLDIAAELIRKDILICSAAGEVYGEFVAHANLARLFSTVGRHADSRFHAAMAQQLGRNHTQSAAYSLILQLLNSGDAD